MKASLELFTKELVNLRHYIQTLDLERVLLGSAIDALRATETEALVLELQDHVELGADKRRFDYNSIIVSLYGFLEQFIESLITEYVHYLNCVVPKYKELPEAITRVHTNLTFGLIKHANYTRFRGLVEEAMLISNLHSCLNDSEKYQVNSKAFSDHTANFRSDVVDSTFSRVGVNDVPRRVKEEPVFQNYLLSKYPGPLC